MGVNGGFGLGMQKCFEKWSWELGWVSLSSSAQDRRAIEQRDCALPGNLRSDYAPRVILAK